MPHSKPLFFFYLPFGRSRFRDLCEYFRVPLWLSLLLLAPLTITAQQTPARFDTLVSLVQEQVHAEVMDDMGLTGKSVKIAILDAGFKHADRHPALAHLYRNDQVLRTWDFVKDRENVYTHSNHGTQVLSALAGRSGDRILGFAQDASFYLFRTEHERKEFVEEEGFWIEALHLADSLGIDILVSSVNFTYARYNLADMNGKRVSVSIAAEAAAQNGMLLIVAMGNEGDSDWRYMGAPADAPSVLSVGGSMPSLRMHIPFASVGPNAIGQMKPEISAPAYMLGPRGKKKYIETVGTSFAAPLVAGIAACIMEKHPEWTSHEVYDEVCRLGHLYPYFDYDLGYGVPDLRKLNPDFEPVDSSTFQVFFVADTVFVVIDSAVVSDSSGHPLGRMLHYHLESSDGPLAAYEAVRIPPGQNAYFFLRRRRSRGILRIWYAGYLWEERMEMIE